MLASEWAQKVIFFVSNQRQTFWLSSFLKTFATVIPALTDRPWVSADATNKETKRKAKDRFNVTVLVESNHNNFFSLHMRATYVFYQLHQ